MNKKRFTNKQIIAAVKAARGLVYLAAKNLQCDPATIHHRAKSYPAIRDTIEAERGFILDFAENRLIQSVDRGEAWAINFLLRTQGRKRGYSERHEFTAEVNITQNLEKLTDDQLTAIATGRSTNFNSPQ